MPAHLAAEQCAYNTEGAIMYQLPLQSSPVKHMLGYVKYINRGGFIGWDGAVPCILHLLIQSQLPFTDHVLGELFNCISEVSDTKYSTD